MQDVVGAGAHARASASRAALRTAPRYSIDIFLAKPPPTSHASTRDARSVRAHARARSIVRRVIAGARDFAAGRNRAAGKKVNSTLSAIYIFLDDRPVCTANDVVSCPRRKSLRRARRERRGRCPRGNNKRPSAWRPPSRPFPSDDSRPVPPLSTHGRHRNDARTSAE